MKSWFKMLYECCALSLSSMGYALSYVKMLVFEEPAVGFAKCTVKTCMASTIGIKWAFSYLVKVVCIIEYKNNTISLVASDHKHDTSLNRIAVVIIIYISLMLSSHPPFQPSNVY